VAPLQCTEYDEYSNQVYKIYAEELISVPFNAVMRKRSSNHYLNVNERTNTAHGRIEVGKPAILFNQSLLGVMGTVTHKDHHKLSAKLKINKEKEERKIHNPFVAENFLKREFKEDGRNKALGNKQYYGDQEIEQMLDLDRGVVNKLTGSYLVAFDSPEYEERQVVDIGLNVKNFTKKVHIADYVRFIAQD